VNDTKNPDANMVVTLVLKRGKKGPGPQLGTQKRKKVNSVQQVNSVNGAMDGIYLFFYYTRFGDFLLAHTVTEIRPRFRGRFAEVCPPTV
jgi:hypothetical protein